MVQLEDGEGTSRTAAAVKARDVDRVLNLKGFREEEEEEEEGMPMFVAQK